MRLTHLTLANFRNYTELEFVPGSGLNVLIGSNAQGKSNLLEAIGLLATGKSFRTTREAELIGHGMPSAAVSGEAAVRAGTIRLASTLTATGSGARKRYTLNGRPVRYTSYLGKLRIVTFGPAHLQLVTGAPGLRRSLMNAALAQESAHYYAALVEYNRQLAQKNALLRGTVQADETLLGAYNDRLIDAGAQIVVARAAFVAELNERARETYARWAGGDGPLELRYAANVGGVERTQEAVRAAFAERVVAQREAEFQRGTALVGPHRDDVEFLLGGRSLAAFGSQGQQRTAVLALKVAEYLTLAERAGETPLLLLDDVLSELDRERQQALLDGVASVEQAFVTATSTIALPAAATYRVSGGRVEAAG